MMRQKVSYTDLNARQQEAYNFQKVSALLADYGYMTIKLSDDYNGADFIAQHVKDSNFLKVQLKGRLTFDKKYMGKDKDLYLTFKNEKSWFIAKHDELLEEISTVHNFKETDSWIKKGTYSLPKLSIKILDVLTKYKL